MDTVLTQARKTAADQYDQAWPLRTSMGDLAREGFLAGWDAAMNQVALLVVMVATAPHHPDDPAHSRDCYDLFKALTGK
jgi:hypothetical protein